MKEMTEESINEGVQNAVLGKKIANEMLAEFEPIIEKHATKWESHKIPATVAAQALQICAIKFMTAFIGCAKDAAMPKSLIEVLIKITFHNVMKELHEEENEADQIKSH